MGFFTLSKLCWFVLEPSHLLIWMLVGGVILSVLRYRAGGILTAICAAAALTLLLLPVGNWALMPFEDAYSRPPWPSHVDGILELGGGLNGSILRSRGVPGLGHDGGSLIATYALAQRYPQARVIFSGGSVSRDRRGVPEARVAEQIFRDMGLDQRRITYEAKSRNTWENIAFSQKLAQPKPHEVWILVATAYHMPRSMAVAQRLGWKMIPWPSDYVTLGNKTFSGPSFTTNLTNLDFAAHEWIGLIAYRADHKAL